MWRGRFPFMSARRESAPTTGPIQLTVTEGIGIPRGVAYISPAALAALGCAPDDVVEMPARARPSPEPIPGRTSARARMASPPARPPMTPPSRWTASCARTPARRSAISSPCARPRRSLP